MDARATLYCLGPRARISFGYDDGAPIVGLGKPLALLVYLIRAPNRTASRERLADLLWGDHQRTAGRDAVRRAVHYLRAHVGQWVLGGNDHVCTASAELHADVDDFAALVASGDHASALERYTGDFLADFASPGCREFEAWADVERAHLRARAVHAGEAWCRVEIDRGRFTDARRAADRVKEIDPLAELGWRLSLEAVVASGDRMGGLAEAARFEAWLTAGGREAEPASRALLQLVRRQSECAGASEATPPLLGDLVGREREYIGLLEAWRRAGSGTTQIVVVTGPAGLGKSRLLDVVAQRIRALRQRVRVVRAYPGERPIAYAFASMLAHELAGLPGAAGVPESVVPHLLSLAPRLGERFAGPRAREDGPLAVAGRATAVRELLAAVSDEAPLALLLDDAHWMDDASRELLAGALARLRDSALLVVVASRLPATGLGVDERAVALPLAPLTASDVGALVASVGALPADAAWPRALVERVAVASHGIPLDVMGALAQLVEGGSLVLRDGAWLAPDETRLADHLRRIDALATRLQALAPPHFRLLLALALAGVPVPPSVAGALAARIAPTVPDALADLDRMGYVRDTGAGVAVAHDAVAEAALQTAAETTRRETRRDLGLTLINAPERQWLEHGVRHLADVGDVDALDALGAPLRALLRQQPTGARAGPMIAFAAAVLGRPATDPVVRAAVRRLPFAVRARRWRAAAGLGAALVLGSGAACTALALRRTPAPSLDVVLREGAAHARVARVELRNDGWRSATPLTARLGAPARDTLPPPAVGAWMVPGGVAWAVEVQSGDTGGVDIAVVDRSGARRRLTWSRADETPLAWSPDGRQLAIQTSAFSRTGFKTLAVLDVASGRIRPLGGREAAVGHAAWSPDGTRIAYAAGPVGEEPTALCVVTPAGTRPTCRTGLGERVALVGWVNDAELLLLTGAAGAPRVVSRLALPDGRIGTGSPTQIVTDLGAAGLASADLSPDGAWVLTRRQAGNGVEASIAQADEPASVRPVSVNAPAGSAAVFGWGGRFPARAFLATVEIHAPTDSVALGAPYRLRARGVSNRGHAIPVRAQEWTTRDPAVATIDSTGTLRPHRPGVVTVEVSAGGWRRARRTFVVHQAPERNLLTETWSAGLTGPWVAFGEPLPRTVTDPALGHAFANAGDGHFFSGAYLPLPLDGRRGIALDAVVRLPITRPQGQYLQVGVQTIHDMRGLRRTWDHRTGYIPARFLAESTCSFVFPAREGAGGALEARPLGGLARSAAGATSALAEGRPTRVRVQVLPDGRCAVALDGERPWISSAALPELDSLYVILQGNSVGTRLLVGPLTVRAGGTAPSGVTIRARRPASESGRQAAGGPRRRAFPPPRDARSPNDRLVSPADAVRRGVRTTRSWVCRTPRASLRGMGFLACRSRYRR